MYANLIEGTRKAVSVALVAAVLALFTGLVGPGSGTARAEEKVVLSSSAQVYEVLKDETLQTFTDQSGIRVETSVYTSDAAVSRLTMGLCDVAAVAGPLSLRYKSLGYQEQPFCKDALVVIGNAQVGVEDLTMDQLRAIFSGTATNWRQVGGPDRPIKVIIPNPESAAYRNFSRMVMNGEDIAYYALAHRSTAAGELARNIPWGISFVNLAATHGRPKGIKVIRIDGLSPLDKDYPFIEPFSLVTKGRPEGAVKKLLEFLSGEKAAKILLGRGVTPCSVCDQGVFLRPEQRKRMLTGASGD